MFGLFLHLYMGTVQEFSTEKFVVGGIVLCFLVTLCSFLVLNASQLEQHFQMRGLIALQSFFCGEYFYLPVVPEHR